MAEKAVLEESLQQKEAQEERLVEELEDLKVKVHQMQGLTTELDSLRLKHQELSEEHTLLLRQKEHLSAGLGEREKGERRKHKIMKSCFSVWIRCYFVYICLLNVVCINVTFFSELDHTLI